MYQSFTKSIILSFRGHDPRLNHAGNRFRPIQKSSRVILLFFMPKHRICACARLAWHECAWESAHVWHGYAKSDLTFYSNCSQRDRTPSVSMRVYSMFTPQFITVYVPDIRQRQDRTSENQSAEGTPRVEFRLRLQTKMNPLDV